MDKILILNFFRFLDNLKFLDNLQKTESQELATDEINRIYDAIGALDDVELSTFLKELGQKMSSASEFNFTGAYKIDLKALKSFTLYERFSETTNHINIKDLCEELNNNKFDLLNTLKANSSEIFRSEYFLKFLLSKVNSEVTKAAILEIGNCTKSH